MKVVIEFSAKIQKILTENSILNLFNGKNLTAICGSVFFFKRDYVCAKGICMTDLCAACTGLCFPLISSVLQGYASLLLLHDLHLNLLKAPFDSCILKSPSDFSLLQYTDPHGNSDSSALCI